MGLQSFGCQATAYIIQCHDIMYSGVVYMHILVCVIVFGVKFGINCTSNVADGSEICYLSYITSVIYIPKFHLIAKMFYHGIVTAVKLHFNFIVVNGQCIECKLTI